MNEVFIAGDNIISSLGFTTDENVKGIEQGVTGIKMVADNTLFPSPVPLSLVNTVLLEEMFLTVSGSTGKSASSGKFTRLEKLFILSVHDAIRNLPLDPADPRTLFILSTTKGNIDLLEERNKGHFDGKRIYLWEMARVVRDFFSFRNTPVVVSNACISGVIAIIVSMRYLRMGLYENAVVTGGDIVSEFVISGFQSFQSLSPEPCRPYDANRNGLSLGEGCGTIVLTTGKSLPVLPVKVTGGAVTNDANHISGPSRTGEELALSMIRTLGEAQLSPGNVGFINAHGTATPFNDEMESKALTIAGLKDVPVNSYKGSWGHTLGAAGVIESVASVHAMLRNILPGTTGFSSLGVPEPIHVIAETRKSEIGNCLKTASGFGGCNASILFQKISL
jgi:3-oxoacyl-[acyl-carrier-protein] synthase-1